MPNIKIKGNRNIVGNNNSFSNEYHTHNHHYHHSDNKNSRDDVLGYLGAISAVTLTTCWFFAKNSTEIYSYTQLIAAVSFFPFFSAWLIACFKYSEDLTFKQMVALSYGLIVALVVFFLINQAGLDPQLIELSHRARNGWEFWQGLNPYGHRLLVEGLVSATALAAIAILNLLMGLFMAWHLITIDEHQQDFLGRILNPFRPNRGGMVIGLLLFLAVAFQYGFMFDLIAYFQKP